MGSGLLYCRGERTHRSALSAYRANFREYRPLHVLRPDGALPSEAALRALVEALSDQPPSPAQTFELAVLRAQLAGYEAPSLPPDFPTCLPGRPDFTRLLQAELSGRLYLPPGSSGLPPLAGLDPARPALYLTWTEAAGYAPHSAGYVQASERPYRVSDRCDGSRDDAAFYVLRTLLFRLRGWGDREYAAFHRAAYPQERRVPQWLTHFSATWRAHEVEVPGTLTPQVLKGLLASLYDMNWRTLSGALEDLDWRFEETTDPDPVPLALTA